MNLRIATDELRTLPARKRGTAAGSLVHIRRSKPAGGFTLIELILVLALLVIAVSIVAPGMSRFIRGRSLDSEARRMAALMHAAQSREVSEGMPMMLWVNEKGGLYGLAAETSGQDGDPKAENLSVDANLQLAVLEAGIGTGAQTTFNNFPAIRFLADGTVDEDSPQALELQDGDGFARWLLLDKLHMGYEINDTRIQ